MTPGSADLQLTIQLAVKLLQSSIEAVPCRHETPPVEDCVSSVTLEPHIPNSHICEWKTRGYVVLCDFVAEEVTLVCVAFHGT